MSMPSVESKRNPEVCMCVGSECMRVYVCFAELIANARSFTLNLTETHTLTHTHIRTYAHIHMHTYTHTLMHTYTHAHVHNTHTHMHSCTQPHRSAVCGGEAEGQAPHPPGVYMKLYVAIAIKLDRDIHTYAHTHIRTRTHMHTCTHALMHTAASASCMWWRD